jgi:hypothetical protein
MGGDAAPVGEESSALATAGAHKIDTIYYGSSTKYPHTYSASNAAELMTQCHDYIVSWQYWREILSGSVSVDGSASKSVWDINTWQTFNTACLPIVTGAVTLGLPNPPAATHVGHAYLAFQYKNSLWEQTLKSVTRDVDFEWVNPSDMAPNCVTAVQKAMRSGGAEDWRAHIINRWSASLDYAPIRWYVDTVWGNGAYINAYQLCDLLTTGPSRTM